MSKPGNQAESRTGRGGGFNERQDVQRKERKDDSDDEYDDMGRKKKKYGRELDLRFLVARVSDGAFSLMSSLFYRRNPSSSSGSDNRERDFRDRERGSSSHSSDRDRDRDRDRKDSRDDRFRHH